MVNVVSINTSDLNTILTINGPSPTARACLESSNAAAILPLSPDEGGVFQRKNYVNAYPQYVNHAPGDAAIHLAYTTDGQLIQMTTELWGHKRAMAI